jgi:hypothetical protein
LRPPQRLGRVRRQRLAECTLNISKCIGGDGAASLDSSAAFAQAMISPYRSIAQKDLKNCVFLVFSACKENSPAAYCSIGTMQKYGYASGCPGMAFESRREHKDCGGCCDAA